MNGALPKSLQDFFDASTRAFDRHYKPQWLIDDFDSPVWRIAFGEGLRTVRGEVKGTARVSWQVRLPDGRLNDPSHRELLMHAKILLVASFDSVAGSSRTLANVTGFHRHLMWMVEYWVCHGPGRHRETGLRGFDADFAESMVATYAARGVEGLGRMRERWDAWILARVQQHEVELSSELALLDPDQKARLSSLRSSVRDFGPAGAANLTLTHDHRTLLLARMFLFRQGAYDVRGLISPSYVEKAISVDSKRLRKIASFEFHLRQFEQCDDYRFRSVPICGARSRPNSKHPSLAEAAEPGRTTASIVNWFYQTSIVIALVPELKNVMFSEPTEIAERVARFRDRSTARTRSLSMAVALRLVGFCIDWMQNVEPSLQDLVGRVVAKFDRSAGARHAVIERSFSEVEMPSGLRRFQIRRFWGQSTWVPNANRYSVGEERIVRAEMGVTDLISLHTAVCFVLITMLSCSRKAEMLRLGSEALHSRGGRQYLKVRLRKTGADEARAEVLKPIPAVAANCVRSLQKLQSLLLPAFPADDSYVRDLVFTKFNRCGLSELGMDLYRHLDLLSETADVRDSDGQYWYVRPHELRRLFALTFFHEGGKENSLPALSWFMGHKELHITWRYVREELTGSELSEVEAALAAAAVLSDDQAKAVGRLRSMLLRHFGVDELRVLSDGVVQEYLEMLHERGTYSAKPIQVRTADGLRFTVLISIHQD